MSELVIEAPAAGSEQLGTFETNLEFHGLKDRVISLLGQKVRPQVVAEACGVSPGYISQLLAMPDVQAEVARLRTDTLEADLKADTQVSHVEGLALKKLEATIQLVRNPLEAARIFQIVNNAKRKALSTAGAQDINGGDVITITLPAAVTAQVLIKTNAQNQVIDVDGRSMAPLPSRLLASLRKPAQVAEVQPLPDKLQIQDVANKVLAEMVTVIDGVRCVL
jgi:hypothetical protein